MSKKIKQYFEITSKRLAIVGICTTLAIYFGMFNYITRLIAFEGFLTLEFTEFIYVIVLLKINLFYSILCIVCCTWLRYIFISNSEPIGLTSLMVGDSLFVIFIAFFLKIFIYYKNKNIFIFVISCILSIFVTSKLMVLANYFIFLDWYQMKELKNPRFLIIIFWFNVLKYFLNILIVLNAYRVIKYLN